MDDETLITGIDFDEVDNMGGLSQVEFYLSQYREENYNYVVNGTQPPNNYYEDALPLFEEMVNGYPNKHMFDKMCQFTRNRHMVYISSRGVITDIRNSQWITLFSKNNTHKRVVKRHKFIHESWTIDNDVKVIK